MFVRLNKCVPIALFLLLILPFQSAHSEILRCEGVYIDETRTPPKEFRVFVDIAILDKSNKLGNQLILNSDDGKEIELVQPIGLGKVEIIYNTGTNAPKSEYRLYISSNSEKYSFHAFFFETSHAPSRISTIRIDKWKPNKPFTMLDYNRGYFSGDRLTKGDCLSNE
jgi:hypothetical protein